MNTKRGLITINQNKIEKLDKKDKKINEALNLDLLKLQQYKTNSRNKFR